MKCKQVLVILFLLFINSFLVLGEANTIASANHSNFSVIKVGSLYDSWTIEEQKNAIHFKNSHKAYRKAIAITNDDSNVGELQWSTKDDFGGLVPSYKLALSEARLVKDSVLDKMHPQMKINFRKRFQKSAELMLEYFDTVETPNINLVSRAHHLHNGWVDFWNSNKKQIKIRTYREKKPWEFWR